MAKSLTSEKFNKEASKFKFNEKAIEKVDGRTFFREYILMMVQMKRLWPFMPM